VTSMVPVTVETLAAPQNEMDGQEARPIAS